MHKYDICCIGHITKDKVVTPRQTVYMPGGTSFYFSHAIRHFQGVSYLLVTNLEQSQMCVVEDLRSKGVEVHAYHSDHAVYFENIYGDNQDDREQKVLSKADPFKVEQIEQVEATYFHLGALLADDFSMEMLRAVAQKGQVSVDAQGYLREVRGRQVCAVDWKDKLNALKHIHTLKVNEQEMEILTGFSDVYRAAHLLHRWGVKEVLMTFGSSGSVIFDGNTFHPIPAYIPTEVVDATGCGDTYTIGYLYQRAIGKEIARAGRFAAAMATIKIQKSGPFDGSVLDIEKVMSQASAVMPSDKL